MASTSNSKRQVIPDWFDHILSIPPLHERFNEAAANLSKARLDSCQDCQGSIDKERTLRHSHTITGRQVRGAVSRELDRRTGDRASAILRDELARIVQRVIDCGLRICRECSGPYVPHRQSHGFCGREQCQRCRRVGRERRRQVLRRDSGDDARRKRLDRISGRLGPQNAQDVNDAIKRVLRSSRSQKVKQSADTDHVARCATRPSYLEHLKKVLSDKGRDDLVDRLSIAVRAVLAGRPKRPRTSGNR